MRSVEVILRLTVPVVVPCGVSHSTSSPCLNRCLEAMTPICPGHGARCARITAMRAVTLRDGDVLVEEHPDPEPGAGEVLVRVHAAGLNGADMMQRRGLYPAPPGAPAEIPGLELAGEVEATGLGAERFSPGDKVMGIVGGGGQAELC